MRMLSVFKSDRGRGLRQSARLILALMGVGMALTGWAAAPAFPPPPDARVEWVAGNMQMNGIAMRVRRFEIDRSDDDVLKFYRRQWRRGQGQRPGYREVQSVPWRVISRLEDDYLMTVQVQPRDRNRSWGYLGVSKLKAKKKQARLGGRFPKMQGSAIVNEVVSRDPGKHARTLVIANQFSIQSNANYYRNYFDDHGWSVRMDRDIGSGHVLAYTQSNGEVNIVISRSKGFTTVVVNDVNSGI
jgi:hypothetical protein